MPPHFPRKSLESGVSAVRHGRWFRQVLLLLLVACSKQQGEPGSCLRGHDNACVEYTREQAAAGKRMCAGMTWANGANSCPAAGRLGTCTKKDVTEIVYSGAPNNFTAASAKSACEFAGGTFTGPGTSP